MTAAERRRVSWSYKTRLQAVMTRIDIHMGYFEGHGDTFVPPHAVLTMLDDLKAAGEGELS